MENIAYLIKDLRERGVGLELSGEDLEISQLGERISSETISLIRDNKAELVKYLSSFSLHDGYSEIPIAPTSMSYPISDAQRRLWVLSQFDDATLAYNMPFQLQLTGGYNINKFKQAIHATINRHEILRTIIKENDSGILQQYILEPEELGFEVGYTDFRGFDDHSNAIQAYIKKDVRTKFDFQEGPLIRASLLQQTDDSYIFYFNMHHIISDGWSMQVLSNDIFAFYNHYGHL